MQFSFWKCLGNSTYLKPVDMSHLAFLMNYIVGSVSCLNSDSILERDFIICITKVWQIKKFILWLPVAFPKKLKWLLNPAS